MRLVENNENIPALEPDSTIDSISPGPYPPETVFIPDKSSAKAASIPDESSTEADSIPDKLGQMKLRIIDNHQYIKVMTKTLLKLWRRPIFRNLVL